MITSNVRGNESSLLCVTKDISQNIYPCNITGHIEHKILPLVELFSISETSCQIQSVYVCMKGGKWPICGAMTTKLHKLN